MPVLPAGGPESSGTVFDTDAGKNTTPSVKVQPRAPAKRDMRLLASADKPVHRHGSEFIIMDSVWNGVQQH